MYEVNDCAHEPQKISSLTHTTYAGMNNTVLLVHIPTRISNREMHHSTRHMTHKGISMTPGYKLCANKRGGCLLFFH